MTALTHRCFGYAALLQIGLRTSCSLRTSYNNGNAEGCQTIFPPDMCLSTRHISRSSIALTVSRLSNHFFELSLAAPSEQAVRVARYGSCKRLEVGITRSVFWVPRMRDRGNEPDARERPLHLHKELIIATISRVRCGSASTSASLAVFHVTIGSLLFDTDLLKRANSLSPSRDGYSKRSHSQAARLQQ